MYCIPDSTIYCIVAGLGEFRIRDLNDEINKLLREKGHWEAQIKELGGPDYQKVGPRMLDHEGKEVPGNRGYKYFGAAKDLPGNKLVLYFLDGFNHNFFTDHYGIYMTKIETFAKKFSIDNYSTITGVQKQRSLRNNTNYTTHWC